MKKKTTKIGDINITTEAIASLTGELVNECYGVVGMASRRLIKDSVAVMLRKDNYSKGVVVKHTNDGIELDIYVIILFGVKIMEVVNEVQKKVKYELENMFDMEFTSINVFVQGIKVID
ncbi:MAG: Asp23/Gls24 family envelope stress response protein [Erysipelotrichaceae bacterium]|nr:Asp23/Gls24 family envelope stress response protein [Erysipelotrichaceae bacterium]